MSAQQSEPPKLPQTARSERHLPGFQQTPKPQAEPDALRHLSADDLETVALRLMELPFGEEGLTRDQIRKRYRDLPEEIYLRMPSSRHFLNAEEALRDVADARSRAEGDFLGAAPAIPERQSIEDGGPPAWGGDPLLRGGSEDGGSAEDREEEIEADASDGAGI